MSTNAFMECSTGLHEFHYQSAGALVHWFPAIDGTEGGGGGVWVEEFVGGGGPAYAGAC